MVYIDVAKYPIYSRQREPPTEMTIVYEKMQMD